MDKTALLQPYAAGDQCLDDVAGVGQRAREPVELGDDERVARAACGEGLLQAGALAVGAGEAVVDEMRSAATPSAWRPSRWAVRSCSSWSLSPVTLSRCAV